jgi:hypothetical protein
MQVNEKKNISNLKLVLKFTILLPKKSRIQIKTLNGMKS